MLSSSWALILSLGLLKLLLLFLYYKYSIFSLGLCIVYSSHSTNSHFHLAPKRFRVVISHIISMLG
jgi:hypothetical protein